MIIFLQSRPPSFFTLNTCIAALLKRIPWCEPVYNLHTHTAYISLFIIIIIIIIIIGFVLDVVINIVIVVVVAVAIILIILTS